MSFVEKLDEESLAFFNEVAAKKFSEQAVAFLNAYWEEVGDQADFIFEVAWEIMKKCDMHFKGIQYVHLYEEGVNNDLNAGLYFYEKLCKFIEEENGKGWADEKFAVSHPEMMTTIKRKRELKEKVDVNFDGKISMLEYLLYQYREFANPANFCQRLMKCDDEPPELKKARLALEEVNRRIQAYEKEKARLQDIIDNGSGVKKLKAKNLMEQIETGPLKEQLNAALITAEAAVRIVKRKLKKMGASGGSGVEVTSMRTSGAMYWMDKDLKEKKKKYGRVKK